jgi:hypothetical protein
MVDSQRSLQMPTVLRKTEARQGSVIGRGRILWVLVISLALAALAGLWLALW